MVDVVSTDEFGKWIRKLKDRQGKLRILKRLDRLANGNPGDVAPVGRGVLELRLDGVRGVGSVFCKRATRWSCSCAAVTGRLNARTHMRAHELADQWRADKAQDGDDDDDDG